MVASMDNSSVGWRAVWTVDASDGMMAVAMVETLVELWGCSRADYSAV